VIRKYALFKVFECVRNTDQEESVRSLARKAEVGVATSKRCLDYLFENKVVKRKVIGRLYQYQLDQENFLTRQLKTTMSLAEIRKSGLIEEILEKQPNVLSIVLYGSVSTGKDTMKSDIDLLIISTNKLKIGLLKSEKTLKRELSIINYSHSEWRKKSLTDKPFYDSVITEGTRLFGEMPVVR